MKRLGKPRRKRKSIFLDMRYCLDIHEDDPEEAKKIGKLFKVWMRDKFSNWDDTILQHFLYDTDLVQNSEDDRFMLEGHLNRIVKDDCSTFTEKDDFDNDLGKNKNNEESEDDDEEIIETGNTNE